MPVNLVISMLSVTHPNESLPLVARPSTLAAWRRLQVGEQVQRQGAWRLLMFLTLSVPDSCLVLSGLNHHLPISLLCISSVLFKRFSVETPFHIYHLAFKLKEKVWQSSTFLKLNKQNTILPEKMHLLGISQKVPKSRETINRYQR